VNAAVKVRLKEEFARLDPVLLLRDIRSAQQALSDVSTRNSQHTSTRSGPADITAFLGSLATAWKNGEVRPTHRRKPTAPRSWRTRTDPFEPVWRTIENWLDTEPTVSAKELMDRLAGRMPELYASKVQLRTLQRRILTWRSERAKELVFGRV
ncbi:MAG: transposase, partial [Vulcanimicrobiaceae bacterium]